MTHTLAGETALITGGSGSFGRAFIRHVLADPVFDGRLISMSRNSEMRYQLEQAHRSDVREGRLVVVPGDVRQVGDLLELEPFGVTTIIHAAAEKHIGTGERFGEYTRSVNYFGTMNVLDFALWAGARRLLALSTDKATVGLAGERPENLYGLTKQEAERDLVSASRRAGALVVALVRYGNVVNSSGSVLGLFLAQRERGRLTLTDYRMTRFGMPVDRGGSNGARVEMHDGRAVTSAVGLVLDALAHMTPGAIFVPDVPSHRIVDLARAIGQRSVVVHPPRRWWHQLLSWLRRSLAWWLGCCIDPIPHVQSEPCEIVEVGIREGERLHEVLISPSEACRTWARPEGGWVILPSKADRWPGGVRVPADFRFSSDQNPVAVEWRESS